MYPLYKCAGADLNVTSAPYNFTALHSVMAILNELSNDISTNDEEGYVRIIMPKHIMAPQKIYLDLARLLIESGADTKAMDIYDKTPTQYAYKAKLYDILELMIPTLG